MANNCFLQTEDHCFTFCTSLRKKSGPIESVGFLYYFHIAVLLSDIVCRHWKNSTMHLWNHEWNRQHFSMLKIVLTLGLGGPWGFQTTVVWEPLHNTLNLYFSLTTMFSCSVNILLPELLSVFVGLMRKFKFQLKWQTFLKCCFLDFLPDFYVNVFL